MMSPTSVSWVVSPRDGWFLKDGREWTSTVAGRGHSLDRPFPSTLLGAFRTAWGRTEEARHCRALSGSEWKASLNLKLHATVALRRPPDETSWNKTHRMWPVPADALFLPPANEADCSTVARLDPGPPAVRTLSRVDDPRETLWRAAFDDPRKPDRAPVWWNEAAFAEWLCDPTPQRKRSPNYDGHGQPRRTMVHVSVDRATGAAAEGLLFAHDVVEPIDEARHEWALATRTDGLEFEASQLTLGNDRRLAALESGFDTLFEPVECLQGVFDISSPPTGIRLIAVTPLVFEGGWLPDGFSCGNGGTVYRGCLPDGSDCMLRSAMLPRPQHVSGWDMAKRRPKPTTRLVPPGAVYFFERADEKPFGWQDVSKLWLAALGSRTDEGYGRVVPGIWH